MLPVIKLEAVTMEPRRSWEALPLSAMTVGQSFLVPPSVFGTLASSEVAGRVRMKAKRMGIRIQVRTRKLERDGEEGLRVERLA